MVTGCAQGVELENTRWLFSMSINTRGVARALVVSLKACCFAGWSLWDLPARDGGFDGLCLTCGRVDDLSGHPISKN